MKKEKLNFFNNKDPWMLAEDIPDIDFQFSQIWLSSFVNNLSETVGINYRKVLCIFKGYNLKFYYGEKDSNNFADHLLRLIVKNPNFGKNINKNIRIFSDKLKNISQKINPNYLKKLSKRQLAEFYLDLDSLHTTLYIWGWLPNAVDMFHGNMTNYLKALLSKKMSEEKANEALVALSVSPEKSIFNLEHESFLRLVSLKQNKSSDKKLNEAVNAHLSKYFYLKHLWLGEHGVYDYKYYMKEINKFIKSREKADNQLHSENKIFLETLQKRKELVKKLRLRKKEKDIFDVYADFAVTKAYRRDAQMFWAYSMDFMFAELSRRLKLPLMHVRFMFPNEVADGLKNGINNKLKKELKERSKHCVYYVEKGKDIVFYKNKAKAIENKIIHQKSDNITELNGQTACMGKVTGRVKVINSAKDMKKMAKGDILVSIATNPDVVPAMKKAGAIVTEQGGITSHAAIVSREMNIPCVIGTKIATKVLKDGDLVEVDANKGVVKILKK